MATITLTINGQAITAERGQTVLEAARAAGIDIPTLCHHPALKSIGACRICLVEVSGQRTLQPACTFPAAERLEVKTESPKVIEARKFIMELIFTERNHFCMYCEMSGACELQSLAYRYGLDHMTYPTYRDRYPVDASPADFLLDHNRCILCRRCLRVCGDLVGQHTLDVRQRGAATMIHADMNLPIGSSSCIDCGNCVDLCPTGALVDKRSAFMGHGEKTRTVQTVCQQCSLGCGICVVTRGDHVLRIEGDWQSPVNGGLLCRKGRFEALNGDAPRVRTPLLRQNGQLTPVTWAEALAAAAARIKAANPRRLGVLTDGAATNETLFLVTRLFQEHLGTPHLMLSRVAGPLLAGHKTGRLQDIPGSDLIVAAGVDVAADFPVASFFIKRAVDAGARLVVVDDQDTILSGFAHEHLNGADSARAATLLQEARQPVMVYGHRLSRELLGILPQLNGKTRLIPLQPGVNALAAQRLGWAAPENAPELDVLYVIAGCAHPEPQLLDPMAPKPFLMVQASHTSPLTDQADVVLPAADWLENTGAVISTLGVMQSVVRIQTPAEQVKPGWEIISLLATELGHPVGSSLEVITPDALHRLA